MSTRSGGIAGEDRDLEKAYLARGLRATPKPGDVLASRPTARADLYSISIVPAAADLTATRHSDAIEKVRELARVRRVDGWFTCNHTHYARVATHRP